MLDAYEYTGYDRAAHYGIFQFNEVCAQWPRGQKRLALNAMTTYAFCLCTVNNSGCQWREEKKLCARYR